MPEVFVAKDAGRVKNPEVAASKNPLPTPKDADPHTLPGHTHNPLSPFCYYPDHVKFASADKEEKVILLLRKHPITNVKWVISLVLALLVPAFFPLFLPENSLPFEYILVISLVWYLMLTAFAIERFLSWFFHVNIVTDERVFDVDFHTIFSREISDANLDQIQDVTVEVGGALRTLFHYGNVVIQTAAEIPMISFDDVPNPDMVARVLRDLRVEEEVEKMEGRVR